MFDDQISYNAENIDLMQLIQKFMLETVYEELNMKTIIQIIDLASNFDENVDINVIFDDFEFFVVRSFDKSFDQLFDRIKDFFSILSFSEMISFSTFFSFSSISISFKSINQIFNFDSINQTSSAPKSAKKKTLRNINANFDEKNILSEKMKKQKIQAIRKQIYFTTLIKANDEDINAFHTIFSIYRIAIFSIHEFDQKHSFIFFNDINVLTINFIHFNIFFIIFDLINKRLHRNILFFEFKNYNQMLKHFLSFNFRTVMIIEIETFKNKNI